MSVTGKRGVGVPVILMHDGEGTIVTVECKNGDTYRGFLRMADDVSDEPPVGSPRGRPP